MDGEAAEPDLYPQPAVDWKWQHARDEKLGKECAIDAGNPPVLFRYVAFRIAFDDAVVEKLAPAALPAGWTDEPPAPSTKALGDLWVKEASSAVLEPRSVIVPGESNYLLNPAQHAFKEIAIGRPGSL